MDSDPGPCSYCVVWSGIKLKSSFHLQEWNDEKLWNTLHSIEVGILPFEVGITVISTL